MSHFMRHVPFLLFDRDTNHDRHRIADEVVENFLGIETTADNDYVALSCELN